jgi:SAM-dependent methyltransferase
MARSMADHAAIRTAMGRAVEERIALMAPARRLRLLVALEVLERWAGRRSIRVLDAGCGDGLLTLEIARRHPTWKLLGLDLREDLLAGARQRARERGLTNTQFERAELTEPLAHAGYDAVLAVECLSEIPEDRRALQMLAAATSLGGLLAVHVPERSWRPILPGSDPTWREEVRHGYTNAEITHMLHAVGVPFVAIQPSLRGSVAVAQEVRDRIKSKAVAIRALAFPGMLAAVRLERLGITWGPSRAMLASGVRRSDGPPVG